MATQSWLPQRTAQQPTDPFNALRREFDEMLSGWSGGLPSLFTGKDAEASFVPRIDVRENEEELTFTAELPGIEEKDVSVTLVGNQLTIKGEKRQEKEDRKDVKGEFYHRIERSYGAFQRVMAIPFDVDPARIAATIKSGVLTVSVPKPLEAKKSARTIEVKKQI